MDQSQEFVVELHEEACKVVVMKLVQGRMSFSFEPLPYGIYQIRTKPDHGDLLEKLVNETNARMGIKAIRMVAIYSNGLPPYFCQILCSKTDLEFGHPHKKTYEMAVSKNDGDEPTSIYKKSNPLVADLVWPVEYERG